MTKPTLLILAAGMGSRFGGLKQMTPMGPNGEWILDYSIFDAIEAGFGKVVFVIRKDFEAEFRSSVGSRIESHIAVDYAFQEKTDLPIEVPHAAERAKPWGTGHAVYAARNVVNEPFAVINADDFYGKKAFTAIGKFLSQPNPQPHHYCMVGYDLQNTLSENGSVSRGICRVDEKGLLKSVEEIESISSNPEGEISGKSSSGETENLSPTDKVSLNYWGFQPDFFTQLEAGLKGFLENSENLGSTEYYLPASVDALISSNEATVEVLSTSSTWIGVTYKEDTESAIAEILKKHQEGEYPDQLWS